MAGASPCPPASSVCQARSRPGCSEPPGDREPHHLVVVEEDVHRSSWHTQCPPTLTSACKVHPAAFPLGSAWTTSSLTASRPTQGHPPGERGCLSSGMVAPTPLISSSMTPHQGLCAMVTCQYPEMIPSTQTLLGTRPGRALGAGPLQSQRLLPPSTPRTGQPHGPRTVGIGTSAGSSTRGSGLWTRVACPLPPDL